MAQHDNKNVFDGLHDRQDFFDNCADLLKKSADNMQLCIVSIDIEKFKLFNEWYGWESGNRLLNSISDCLINFQNHKTSIAGHFGDDDFAFFMEHDEDKIKKLCAAVNAQIKLHCHKMNMLPSFGIYPISDKPALSIRCMTVPSLPVMP